MARPYGPPFPQQNLVLREAWIDYSRQPVAPIWGAGKAQRNDDSTAAKDITIYGYTAAGAESDFGTTKNVAPAGTSSTFGGPDVANEVIGAKMGTDKDEFGATTPTDGQNYMKFQAPESSVVKVNPQIDHAYIVTPYGSGKAASYKFELQLQNANDSSWNTMAFIVVDSTTDMRAGFISSDIALVRTWAINVGGGAKVYRFRNRSSKSADGTDVQIHATWDMVQPT